MKFSIDNKSDHPLWIPDFQKINIPGKNRFTIIWLGNPFSINKRVTQL